MRIYTVLKHDSEILLLEITRGRATPSGTNSKVDSIPARPWGFLQTAADMHESVATLAPTSGTQTGNTSRAPSVPRREETGDSEKAGRVWARSVTFWHYLPGYLLCKNISSSLIVLSLLPKMVASMGSALYEHG